MKHLRWQVLFGVSLIFLSALLYFVHYLFFHDAHHIFIYLVGDIAFVPVEVLLVTLIIHRLLERRERRSKLEKINMVIEVFFSEVGTKLLTYFSDHDPDVEDIRGDLSTIEGLSEKDFASLKKRLENYGYVVRMENVDLEALSAFMTGKRGFLVSLWENPNLLENETFTEVLRAVMHLTEELANREDFSRLPDSDREHLGGDIKRAYSHLVIQWIDYMKHLKQNYPYLFSLAARTNPFDKKASPLVTG
jgi:hypothetical protein